MSKKRHGEKFSLKMNRIGSLYFNSEKIKKISSAIMYCI